MHAQRAERARAERKLRSHMDVHHNARRRVAVVRFNWSPELVRVYNMHMAAEFEGLGFKNCTRAHMRTTAQVQVLDVQRECARPHVPRACRRHHRGAAAAGVTALFTLEPARVGYL